MNAPLDDPRVQPPGNDEESLREYGRQLALDSLLELALGGRGARKPANGDGRSPFRAARLADVRWRKSVLSAAAVAASLLLGVAVWWSLWPGAPRPAGGLAKQNGDGTQGPPVTALASGWRIESTGNAEYRVVKPDCIRLDRGELLVESAPLADGKRTRLPLTIETPAGKATAAGTRFYIGTHPLEPVESPKSKGTNMTTLTRVLVLAGVVTLANAQGSVTAQANHLLAAEAGKAPADHAVTANSGFAVDLYRQLAKENQGKNLFFSPYSMSSALAMTAEGARGETAAQMGKVLRFPEAARHVGDDAQLIPWNTALIHTGMAALNERFNPKPAAQDVRDKIAVLRKELDAANRQAAELRAARKWQDLQNLAPKSQQIAAELNELLVQVDQYELRVANALWGEKTDPFRQSYIDTINKYYQTGGLFPVDFRGDPEGSRKRINAWVENQTKDRIKDLIPRGAINPLTALVLTNAIYFKGEWAQVFAEKDTKDDEFALADGTKLRVPMMHRSMDSASYAAMNGDGTFFDTPGEYDSRKGIDEKKFYPNEHGFQILELPYKGKELSMVLFVPRAADGLASIENLITAEILHVWIGRLQKRSVKVFMPKFKLETTYEMNKTLQTMGMVRAFRNPAVPDGAQFEGMCASPLYISTVLHKAFVEVNEKGTEAAAATAVVMEDGGGVSEMEPFTPTFRADKPFVFAIRDVKTGTILFLGRVTNPKG